MTVAGHPNVVSLYEAHQIDGVAFLVMELCVVSPLVAHLLSAPP